ncbi:MAG TPA: hypothetical protein PLG45_00295, partial [Candidatus Paceibacterota bacterium]|nr:hypothetical protein [Candidatus Paceibacterota bacterium]
YLYKNWCGGGDTLLLQTNPMGLVCKIGTKIFPYIFPTCRTCGKNKNTSGFDPRCFCFSVRLI